MPFVPKFGEPGGPCDRVCGHYQCALLIQIAGTPCTNCGRKIGYGRAYVEHSDGTRQHVDCNKAFAASGRQR
jgi:hypothetical protein